jgi:hypothetical protein
MMAALLHALAATALAGVAAVPLGVALARLPAAWAATLGAGLAAVSVVPLPGGGSLAADAVPLLPLVALPLGWGLRRIPAATLRIAASLTAPALVLRRIWLPLAAPWLLAGLGLALARALAGAGLDWPSALLLAATAWLALRRLAGQAT